MMQKVSWVNSFTEVKWQELLSHCLSICPHFLPSNYQSPDVRLMMCIRDVLLSNHSPLNSMPLTADGRKWLSPELHVTDVEPLCISHRTTAVSETNTAALCLHRTVIEEDQQVQTPEPEAKKWVIFFFFVLNVSIKNDSGYFNDGWWT